MNLKYFALMFLVVGLTACASKKQAELSTSNPSQAFQEITDLRERALDQQVDLTAHNSFFKAERAFQEAEDEMRENNPETEEILSELREAKAYYLEAISIGNSRTEIPQRLLKSRSHVLKARVYQDSELTEELFDIDSDLRIESDMFSETLSADDFSDFQKEYQQLEIQSRQAHELEQVREVIASAEKKDAQFVASKTLNKAKTDLNAAENIIRQNVRNPQAYRSSVLKAHESADLLRDVLAKLRGEASGSSEEVALKLVKQERKLGRLESEVSQKNQNLSAMSQTLAQTSNELLTKRQKIRFQEAMEAVQNEFDESEAEVYQQKDKLILRLKNINFKTNSAVVPADSFPMLNKVSSIVKNLNPEAVIIEGHTDSRGAEDYNKDLSLKRARSVSQELGNMLKGSNFEMLARGLGETDPIASNETSDGRAQNRRVDIVIDAK